MFAQKQIDDMFYGHVHTQPHKWEGKPKGYTFKHHDDGTINLMSYISRRAYAMAGKRATSFNGWGNTEFVNVSLNTEQTKDFKSWFPKQSETFTEVLGQVMVDDYKVSCNWDDNNQCFIATLTGKPNQSVNSGKALSARSDDWWEALALVLYKHLVIFKNSAWNGELTRNNWG